MTAVVDFPIKPEARPYVDAFAEVAGEPQWLRDGRRHGLARFAEMGFPSRKSENWRYFDLQPLAQRPLLPAEPGTISAIPPDLGFDPASDRVILLDGVGGAVVGRSPLPAGIWIAPMRRAIGERPDLVRVATQNGNGRDDPFALLNTALFTDGFVLEVAPGAALDRPVEIVHFASRPGSAHTRSLINLGAGSRASIIETYAGEGAYWRNDVVTARLADGAKLIRTVVVEEAAEAVHLGRLNATLGAAARFDSVVLLLGGSRMRQEIQVRCAGEGTHCGLFGAFLAADRQEANIVTTVEHQAVRGDTREVFKGVAAGRGHGAFQGRITVQPGAQKTDAHMLSRNLLLGGRAAIDTKPELEILADDVKCSHGAAVGDLDEAALFYLLARGIPPRQARRILIEAFVREAVDFVGSAALRDHLRGRLARRLAALEE
jgi:Fe-S cluster assembly protein SufD